jgi:hypothetical protein
LGAFILLLYTTNLWVQMRTINNKYRIDIYYLSNLIVLNCVTYVLYLKFWFMLNEVVFN